MGTPPSREIFMTASPFAPLLAVQYTFEASTAMFSGSLCADASTVGVPPPTGTIMTAPSM
jgi:hypothetical protein